MEMNEQNMSQLEKFKEKLEKSETKKRGRKKKIEEDIEMKVEKATQNVEAEKAVQEVEAEKPIEAVETEKITDKLKSQLEFRLIYWNDMQKEFDHLEYRIYKGIKKEIDEIKEMQKKILSVLGYENDVFNDKQ